MKKSGVFILCSISLLLASCFRSKEEFLSKKEHAYIEKVLGSEIVSLEPLLGGLSGARLFKTYVADTMYVLRYVDNTLQEDWDREVHALTIASHAGYGPHVYHIHKDSGLIIMEYIQSDVPSVMCIEWEKRCPMLIDALKKVHNGPMFNASYNSFERLTAIIKDLHSCPLVDMSRISSYMRDYACALRAYPHRAPCHNDINPHNMLVRNNALTLIDYEYTGMGDPYFDLATVAIFCTFCKKQEKELLRMYLGHKPYKKERAKFSIMKNVALLCYGTTLLSKVPADVIASCTSNDPNALADIFESLAGGTGDIDVNNPRCLMLIATNMLRTVDEYMESGEFYKNRRALTTG